MFTIRPAQRSDEAALGRYGAALMRQHHQADPRRFLLTERPEVGYGRFLLSELDDPDALVLVAESEGEVLGYLYAGLEGTSWKNLRGPCAYLHDVYVDERLRREGAGRSLVRAAIEWARSKGAPQVVLTTLVANEPAHRLFTGLGFRRTMVEMALSLERE
jgi:GNAT superfamily N-acetyltransferase